MVGWKVPDLTVRTPTVAPVDLERAETRVDRSGKILLVQQVGLAVLALARRSVGFGLGGPLGQQTQRFLGCQRNLLFDKSEVLFRMLPNMFQASLQVLVPGLQFGVGQAGCGDQGRTRGLRGGRRALLDDLLDEALLLLALSLAGSADLGVGPARAPGLGGGDGHGERFGFKGWVDCGSRKRSAKRGCKG